MGVTEVIKSRYFCRNLMASVAFFTTLNAFAQKSETVSIMGDHGKLSAIIQTPKMEDGKKVPMVMILHGFTGNKNEAMLKMLADKLQSKGIASIRFDFNGHGESEGEFVKMTVPNEIVDAQKVYEYVKTLPYVKDISIAGHSQGGVVTSMVAGMLGKKAFKKAVLLAPAAVLREDAIRGNTMGKQYNSMDPPEYVELWGGKKLGRDYILTARTLKIFETAKKFTGKVCLIHGTGDVIAPYSYSERYASDYKHSELHLLDGYDHGFSQSIDNATDIAVKFLSE